MTGFELTRNYRESYNIFACSGILFNHESERRGFEFVTRKITSTVAAIKKGRTNTLVLGNLSAKRDWGHAADYVLAMWLMLQQKKPDDYVVATGKNHSVRDFLNVAFDHVNLKFKVVDFHQLSEKKADKEIEKLSKNKGVFIVQHPRYYRPAEVNELLGDAKKAAKILGWKPRIPFDKLVKLMVENDVKDRD